MTLTAQQLAAWPVLDTDEDPAAAAALLERGRVELPDEEGARVTFSDDGAGGGDPPELPPTDDRPRGRGDRDRPPRPSWPRKVVMVGVILFFFALAFLGGAAWGKTVGKGMTWTLGIVDRGMA